MHCHGVSEPRRPDPVVSWQGKLRSRFELARERVRHRSVGTSITTPVAVAAGPSMVVTLLLAVGSAALALAGLWAWQTWSQRSSEPIDDLLPMLVSSTAEAPERSGETSVAVTDAVTPVPAAALEPVITRVPEIADEPAEIIVHVSGAVADPGVVTLLTGARVFEAVSDAGGATDDADLERVNLAALVADGEHVHVPAFGEEVPPELVATQVPSFGANGTPTPEPVVDINTATATDLESLPGVGPAIAEAIVQTRFDRGPFLAVEELLDVPGIGDAKLALLAPHVVVG